MAVEQGMSVADILRGYRRSAGMTQEELANRAHMSARAISNLERGVNIPYTKTLMLLADALHLSADDRHQLESAVRRAHASTVPVATAPATTLPLPLTRLIGRDQEIDALHQLILHDHYRLVTLTGPAGIGKTRLALGMTSQLKSHFPDGIWFIPLASLRDWHLIPASIAQALDIQEDHQQSLWDRVSAYLANKELLLILDNLEHLLEGGAFVADLLSSCPELVIMVTSRAPLRVRGERRFPVPPLSYAEASSGEGGAAEELFLERAREVQPLLPLTHANMTSIAAICRRLEGIPLAIELAATRVATFTPTDLLRWLDHRLSLLTMGTRDLPQRQQTMRDAIAWSYDLLAPSEQEGFRQMAVFTGGWTLSAAQAVCSAGSNIDDLLMIVSALTDANLIQRWREEDAGEPRFAMLEILREYGLEQLAHHEELEGAQRRHAAYMLTLAQTAEPALKGPEQAHWLRLLDQELGNLRAVLQWAKEHDAQLGLQLTSAVWRFWLGRRHLSEGRAWLEAFLAQTQERHDQQKIRAHACLLVGVLAAEQRDIQQAEQFAEAGLRIYQEEDDREGMCSALSTLGNLTYMGDQLERAEIYYRQSLALGRTLDDPGRISVALNNLASLVTTQGRYLEAISLLNEALAHRRSLGDQSGITAGLINLSNLYFKEGDYERADAAAKEALNMGRQSGNRRYIASTFDHLGKIACGRGDYEQALIALEQSRQLFAELNDEHGIATVLRHMGDLACEQDDWQSAEESYRASLALYQQIDKTLGIAKCLTGLAKAFLIRGQETNAAHCVSRATALFAAIGIAPRANISVRLEKTKRIIHQALGDDAFQAAWERGQTLSVADLLGDGT